MTSTSPIEIDRDKQLELFGSGSRRSDAKVSKQVKRPFVRHDPEDIAIGKTPLREHLEGSGVREPFVIRELLLNQDWSGFEASYAPVGRAPYAPEAMMGLVLYGILQGVSSLRGLKKLARLDLGCMWVTGGICPDHANIARFIDRHSDLIEGSLFEGLTRTVLKQSGSSVSSLAGDGTVIEAACAKYGLLKSESLHELARKAKGESDNGTDDPGVRQRQDQVEEAQRQLSQRQARRKAAGKTTGNERVSVQEPDAMVQRGKRGRGSMPSYKPSVLSNDRRIIVGYAVDPSSESRVLGPMLDQANTVGQTAVEELMVDAGYFSNRVIDLTLDRDISLLCPEGREPGPRQSQKYYPKGHFDYEPTNDVYRCPQGEALGLAHVYRGSGQNQPYRAYGTSACASCDQLTRCTRRRKGRLVKRYEGDEKKDALRFVMSQVQAKRRYQKRQAFVEPVFSSLRGRQGLNRFRRKGLARVTLEFALHALAHNLGRAVAIRRLLAIFIVTEPPVIRLDRLFRRFSSAASQTALIFNASPDPA